MPSSDDLARILLEKARADEFATRKLAESAEAPDEMLGFHAQQAVEKSLKAVLTHSGIRYRKIHDLDYLAGLAGDSGIDVPNEVAAAYELTPWATTFRYEEPEHVEPLDRDKVLQQASGAVAWAAGVLGESADPPSE